MISDPELVFKHHHVHEDPDASLRTTSPTGNLRSRGLCVPNIRDSTAVVDAVFSELKHAERELLSVSQSPQLWLKQCCLHTKLLASEVEISCGRRLTQPHRPPFSRVDITVIRNRFRRYPAHSQQLLALFCGLASLQPQATRLYTFLLFERLEAG